MRCLATLLLVALTAYSAVGCGVFSTIGYSPLFGSRTADAVYLSQESFRVDFNIISKLNAYTNDGCVTGVKPTYGWSAPDSVSLLGQELGVESSLSFTNAEYVIKIDVKLGSCIDYIKFYTNKGNQLIAGDKASVSPLTTVQPNVAGGYLGFLRGWYIPVGGTIDTSPLEQIQFAWNVDDCPPPSPPTTISPPPPLTESPPPPPTESPPPPPTESPPPPPTESPPPPPTESPPPPPTESPPPPPTESPPPPPTESPPPPPTESPPPPATESPTPPPTESPPPPPTESPPPPPTESPPPPPTESPPPPPTESPPPPPTESPPPPPTESPPPPPTPFVQGDLTLFLDTLPTGGEICPGDASNPTNSFDAGFNTALLSLGVTNLTTASVGCATLQGDPTRLRWTFNAQFLYDNVTNPNLPFEITKLESYPDASAVPSLCSLSTEFTNWCNSFDATGTTVVGQSGSASNIQTCDATSTVFGLADFVNPDPDIAAVGDSTRNVFLWFIDEQVNSASVAIVDVEAVSPGQGFTGDTTALQLFSVASGDKSVVYGRPIRGPTCPSSWDDSVDPLAAWGPDATIGTINSLGSLFFRANAVTGSGGSADFNQFDFLIKITQNPLGTPVTNDQTIDLVWRCGSQTDVSLCSTTDAWNVFAYPDVSDINVIVRVNGQNCDGQGVGDFELSPTVNFGDLVTGAVSPSLGTCTVTLTGDERMLAYGAANNGLVDQIIFFDDLRVDAVNGSSFTVPAANPHGGPWFRFNANFDIAF